MEVDHPDYDVVAPGSICAQHGCDIIHPDMEHADYIFEFAR